MILIGQYDSPFVRRVGIALALYDLPFEHRPWSVFGDGDRVRAYNPLMRVPTLVLDDGEVLVESHSMLDYLDSIAPEGTALFPRQQPARRRAMTIAALAMGAAEKAVALFYEQRLHDITSDIWVNRCRLQIGSALDALEAGFAAAGGPFWAGGRIGHADIAIAAALRFIAEAHPGVIRPGAHPAIEALAARLEALPVFQTIHQPFIPPA